jgi:hypothetical protein
MGLLHPKKGRAATGRALIVRDRSYGYTDFSGQGARQYTPTGGATLHTRVWVRVTPDDGGPEFESQASAWGGDEEHLVEGHETYVRFDPNHRESCDIDRDRLEREFGRVAGKRRTAIPGWVTAERAAEQKARTDGTLKPGEKFDPLANVRISSTEDQRPTGDDVVTGLSDLIAMHAKGVLTDSEFAEAKARLLCAE